MPTNKMDIFKRKDRKYFSKCMLMIQQMNLQTNRKLADRNYVIIQNI